jgi:uncharacterized Rmd1/YagE family protein
MQKAVFVDCSKMKVRALLIGQNINIKALEKNDYLAMNPLVVTAGQNGCAILFRYGAIAIFNITPEEEKEFLVYLSPFVTSPIDLFEVEEVELHQNATLAGKIEGDIIFLSKFSLENLQIVADILAKSVILAYYEARTARAFDRIEPFAVSLQNTRWNRQQVRELLGQLGNTLSIDHKMVGRVEIIDKPELLWEYPEFEPLYRRLAIEYEVRERHLALERKLELVFRTAETALGLLQHNTNLRVEWYIVILIVVEIILSLYEILAKSFLP